MTTTAVRLAAQIEVVAAIPNRLPAGEAFRTQVVEWLARKDSNLRSPDPESGALPLGHSPVTGPIVRSSSVVSISGRGWALRSAATSREQGHPRHRNTGTAV